MELFSVALLSKAGLNAQDPLDSTHMPQILLWFPIYFTPFILTSLRSSISWKHSLKQDMVSPSRKTVSGRFPTTCVKGLGLLQVPQSITSDNSTNKEMTIMRTQYLPSHLSQEKKRKYHLVNMSLSFSGALFPHLVSVTSTAFHLWQRVILEMFWCLMGISGGDKESNIPSTDLS